MPAENVNRKSIFKNLKIRGADSHSIKGRLDPLKTTKKHYKKPNQDCSFSRLNFASRRLGEISLFGVFDGNGRFGTHIASTVKQFFVEHFTNCRGMKVNSMVDNFYGILIDSFFLAQENLIKNEEEKGYNLDFSGATGCVLLYPNNNSNKIYCANIGCGKCVVYSSAGTYHMSYEHTPDRPSERERIKEFVKNLEKEQREFLREKIIEKKNELYEEYQDKNKHIIFNNVQISPEQLNIPEYNIDYYFQKKYCKSRIQRKGNFFPITREEKEKEAQIKSSFLRSFESLRVSRAFGNLAAGSKGVIPEPEIVECDLKLTRAKFAVLGTAALWKFLDEAEIGTIVRKYETLGNGYMACRELESVARQRWKSNCRKIDDISVIVVFFEQKN